MSAKQPTDGPPPVSGTKPLVHGYVRMEEPDENEIALRCKDMARFCALSGYRLGSIFIDRGVPDDVFARHGFTDLLDALRLTQAYAVVVPALEHLSTQEFIQDALIRMVALTGSKVLVAYQVNGHGPEFENGLDIGSTPGATS